MTSSLSIGIDLGATKIAGVLADPSGRALAARHLPTLPQRGHAAVLDDIARMAAELEGEAAALGQTVQGIGVGSPGMCDPVGGTVYNAVNLGWEEVPLVAELRARLSGRRPVFLQKDANAAALGEYYLGAARGCSDFIYLSIGSGLGGGVMAAGQLINGANWNATEVGHISLDPEHGRLCACGLRGCAETVVSGPGLAAVAAELRGQMHFDSPLDDGHVTPARVLEAARTGDRLALTALAEVGVWLGVVAAAGIAFLNPERLIIGGGLGIAAFDQLLPALRTELERRLLPASYIALQILPSRLESSAVGAASMVWYGLGIKTEPEEVASNHE